MKLAWIVLLILIPFISNAFSVLTHEAVIDAAWEPAIVPLLKDKFPEATPEQIKESKAFAYGGAIMPDMGYYPMGNAFFSELTHYVRTGDFVISLLRNSRTLSEYAFALGSLAHYNADDHGHPIGVNPTVSLLFPKLKKKYGDTIAYEKDPVAHRRVELSFDVLKVAESNYNVQQYHDFIGFQVSEELLEKAFEETYGLPLKSLFINLGLTINIFRWSVKEMFPEIINATWLTKKDEIMAARPGITERDYKYRMSRRDFKNEFLGKGLQRVKSMFMVGLVSFFSHTRIIRSLKFIEPDNESERLYHLSFKETVKSYSSMLRLLSKSGIRLENIDYDTGNPSSYDEYPLADKAYRNWVLRLKDDKYVHLKPEMKTNILEFYSSDKLADDEKLNKALSQIKSIN